MAKFRDCLDGTSQTVLLAETVRGDQVAGTQPSPAQPHRRIANWTGTTANAAGQQGFLSAGNLIRNPNLATVFPTQINSYRGNRADAWIRAVPFSTMINGYLPPNSSIPDIGFHGRGFYASRSYHRGGAMHAMLDGSVRFFTQSMDVQVYRAHYSRNGSEVVESR